MNTDKLSTDELWELKTQMAQIGAKCDHKNQKELFEFAHKYLVAYNEQFCDMFIHLVFIGKENIENNMTLCKEISDRIKDVRFSSMKTCFRAAMFETLSNY